MASHVENFKEWTSSIREDIDLLEAIVSDDTIERQARRYAAAALNYLITRMDLVPDWEESIGVLDDAMVIRLCVELASLNGLDAGLEEAKHIVAVGRLINEVKVIEDFLGSEMHEDLRNYCAKLTDTSVRGRGVMTILEDEAERTKLFAEVESDLKRMPPASFSDPEALAAKFKSYLQHKLTK
jgi:uncharacterized membrane protein YkvA (DUF1232 family)